MSLETVLAATEASVASATAPAPSPSAESAKPTTPAEEPKVIPAEQPIPAEPIEETEPNIEEAPETSGDFQKYKPLFKDNPELRNIIGREKAFSELGNFSDVRAIVERIPTVEDAETLVSKAEAAEKFGQTFRGDLPLFLESLKDSDPLAFQQFATKLPDVLAETSPELFSEQARIYTNRVMSNVLATAQQSGDKDFLAAVQMVAQYLGIQPGQGSQPRSDNSEAARLRKQLADRDQTDASQAFQSFWGQTDEAIIGNCVTEIDRTLKHALPNATEKQLQRISREVWAKTLENLNAQPQFRSQLDGYRSSAMKGRQSIADHKAIVDFSTRRAKLVIPKVAKDVISEWSKEVLQLSTETLTKKKDIAASTKDVGTGPQGTTSAATPSTNGNGKPRSLNSIYEQIESGTYAKR